MPSRRRGLSSSTVSAHVSASRRTRGRRRNEGRWVRTYSTLKARGRSSGSDRKN